MSKFISIPAKPPKYINWNVFAKTEDGRSMNHARDIKESLYVFDAYEDNIRLTNEAKERLNGAILGDWFGVSFSIDYARKHNLIYRSWDEFSALDDAAVDAWIVCANDRFKTLDRLSLLLMLPENILSKIPLKFLNRGLRQVFSNLLVAKELGYAVTKPIARPAKTFIRTPISKDTLKNFEFLELKVRNHITNDSPLFIRELTGFNSGTSQVTNVDWDSVYSYLSGLQIVLTKTDRHPFLGTYLLVDSLSSSIKRKPSIAKSARDEVAVNVSKMFECLSPVDELLTESKKLIDFTKKLDTLKGSCLTVYDYVQSIRPEDDIRLNSHFIESTNPISKDLVNIVAHKSSGYLLGSNDTISSPAYLRFVADLYESGLISYEAVIGRKCTDSNHELMYNPERMLRGYSSIKVAANVRSCSVAARLCRPLENLIYVCNLAGLNLSTVTSASIQSHLNGYLKSDSDIQIVLDAIKAYLEVAKVLSTVDDILELTYNIKNLDLSGIIDSAQGLIEEAKISTNQENDCDIDFDPLHFMGGLDLKSMKFKRVAF